MGNTETTGISARWISAYSLKQNWRRCLGLARLCVSALITTYSTVCHRLYQWFFMFIHLHIQCDSTVLPCPSVSLWEQYRVSMWVGLLWGPGWFRSDGRRKLLQEIPNCQTHTLTQSTIFLSIFPESRLKLQHKLLVLRSPVVLFRSVSAQSD